MKVLAVALWLCSAAAVVYVGAWPRSTSERLLRAGPARRVVRGARARLLRMGAALLGWPHVLDVARGALRAPATAGSPQRWAEIGPGVIFDHGGPQSGERVLVVHSLLTEPAVLDLAPGRSLVEGLRDQGHQVHLLDWPPAAGRRARRERRTLDLSQHALTVAQAIETESHAIGGRPIHVVGYCLGATLALVVAARDPRLAIASLTLVAPVGDTAVDRRSGRGIGRLLAHPHLHPAAALDGSGHVPAPVVREAFHLLRPRALQTVRRWSEARRQPDERRVYTAMARWAWSHRPLPGAVLFDLVDLYRHGSLADGRLRLRAGEVDLSGVTCPLLVVTAAGDHIVPPTSSTAVLDVVGSAERRAVEAPTGHVALLVGDALHGTVLPAIGAHISRHRHRSDSLVSSGRPR